jgi:hypothetical protein
MSTSTQFFQIPWRARLVSESEVAKLEEKRERVRREYVPKGGFIVDPAKELDLEMDRVFINARERIAGEENKQ